MPNETPAATTPGVTTTPDPTVGLQTGTESNLSNWAGSMLLICSVKAKPLATKPIKDTVAL